MRPLRSYSVAACAVVGLLVIGSRSSAQNTYNVTFDFTGSFGTNIVGSLLATSTNGTDFTATSGSATLTGHGLGTGFQAGTYSLLAPVSFGGNDNSLPLDLDGITFGDAGYKVNIFNDGSSNIAIDNVGAGDAGNFTFSATLTAVPELSSVLGFGSFIGLGGIGLLRKCRRNAVTTVS